jgi:hypothetical protein
VHEQRGLVRNVTFSADEDLIERAREVAKAEHKTLNVAFREWLTAMPRVRAMFSNAAP